ncbi:MAG: transporter substrate-binding domain-containing protein, partial [Xanthobacteraceae bacterium]|nr:transporter substrate-binding domain-containing protein [Xanthobacteraceae bacterium]
MRLPRSERLGRRAAGLRIGGFLILFACSTLLGLVAPAAAEPQAPPSGAQARVLRGGWFPLDPYQYREYRRGTAVLTGYDVEIERALARILGVDIQLPEVAWEKHLADVADGKADIAAGATFSKEREGYAYFSKPYRQETDVLVLRRAASAHFRFSDPAQMLETFEREHFRLGVIAGFTYASDKVNAYIADPTHEPTIVKVGDDSENLRNLLDGVVDGFIADRIVAATVAWRQRRSGDIEEYPLYMTTPIHFMLARATQSPAMLDRLNGAIDEIRRTGEIQHIADAYALPVLIHQTLDTGWFKALALLGTVAFTLSGVVLAHAGRYTLFGALVLASIPALGGGVLRDLVFQREPLGVVRDPTFVLAVIATVMLGMAFFKIVSLGRAQRLVEP